jgi:cytochrome c556
VLQDELRARARQLVIASGTHDRSAIANEFAAVAKSCVSCHQVFVHGDGGTEMRR